MTTTNRRPTALLIITLVISLLAASDFARAADERPSGTVRNPAKSRENAARIPAHGTQKSAPAVVPASPASPVESEAEAPRRGNGSTRPPELRRSHLIGYA